jgi:hypothetical protein
VPLGVVFFALIAGLLLYWIHRGFRPRR